MTNHDMESMDTQDNSSERNFRIKSFARRQGRITDSQQKAMDELWPRFGLEADTPLAPLALFGNEHPIVLEIGFGNGDSLVEMAKNDPSTNFVGIEVHKPGVGHILIKIREAGIENLRVYAHDAIDILNLCVSDHTLQRVQLFFPDPWHKTRHHKRRIVKKEFLDLIARKLRSGGHFHAATDWEHYAYDIAERLSESEHFHSSDTESPFSPRPEYRPLTKFEARGHRLGHGVWDLIWTRH